MVKATHYGHCQCCGRRQKLPGGFLSTHGYDVKYGFFQGVCQGTKELPYERSCDLIKTFVQSAEAKLKFTLEQIERLMTPATEPKAFVRLYNRRLGISYWRDITIESETIGSSKSFYHIEEDGYEKRKHYLRDYRLMRGNTAMLESEVATLLNADYARWLETHDQVQIENYIKWQNQRIEEWKLVELTDKV